MLPASAVCSVYRSFFPLLQLVDIVDALDVAKGGVAANGEDWQFCHAAILSSVIDLESTVLRLCLCTKDND